jgi:membrane fusion protein (multidrug efflux system)
MSGLALLAALPLSGCGKDAGAPDATMQRPPAQVVVTTVTPRTVTLERIYPARAQAAEDVEVRARVQGILLERKYTEGARVKAGDVLFRIDPAIYQARMAQAEAGLSQAEAQHRQAEREWKRIEKLFGEKAVSERDRDAALSALELAQAAVKTAQAGLRDARIQLDYTEVRAPISGYAGMRAVSEGNLLQPGALLTTVRQLDTIHALFSVPEADALAQRERLRSGGDNALAATLQLSSGSSYPHAGRIDYTDQALDPRTGTVQARAVFRNADGLLLPGQFVRVSVDGLTLPNVIVLPTAAVAQGPQGTVVYVVDAESKAQAKPVKLGPKVPQGQVIEEGLAPGDKAIIGGLIGVMPGAPVAPVEAPAADGAAR